MSKSLEGTQTKENLMRAFAGESQARNRYTFAAEEAKKQGQYSIAEIFLFTADQERAHAERYYDLLKSLSGSNIVITAGYPVDNFDDILKLLKTAHHNEFEEYEDIYPAFGDIAKEEGFFEVASAFYQIAEIEKVHGKRFGLVAEMLESGTYYNRGIEGQWMCLNCGHIHTGNLTPEVCPTCRHEKGYFIPIELAPFFDKVME
ncbi:rubrerythrin [Lachnospiraceae bacterium LCP25S3_G4]